MFEKKKIFSNEKNLYIEIFNEEKKKNNFYVQKFLQTM